MMSMTKISKIVSGGQSGVDRAALDFAMVYSIEYGGWCPKGGWAEDYTEPPGLLTKYKNLKETPFKKTVQRTRWNVRDSDATLIIIYQKQNNMSSGTDLTIYEAQKLNKPHYVLNLDNKESIRDIIKWLNNLVEDCVLNIAGPRESESPNIYKRTYSFLTNYLDLSLFRH
jgi:hypothetical protein